ncbi:CDP-glycerol glycerophosphotransferase family protein [Campylobacter sp. VicNov18]|uniref:CDP-glycerol glycerophosphotransferase family protein n=1 Tax=Campylobacter bilis TaxID=2691918 RepID=UPI00130E87F2|nr:CDP-glycerol glycerophosphotransferase family protein [Campylobacter bilis]MPV64171.1 glycosyltransferase [Campylobacter hepaticus]MBM0637675.1 glycosyltransferase [Campylobacter bilis]MCC8278399.1 CDP-glycerol glycerophosphotransferase family protein [Campylobacter bilis]MCC8299903.1 CDP-glycerol glycerophosphotransferase family protein [Campylobacter bilis]MCC8301308.1 CDP-glycerol glycerophosphotransferase family protein [Campylobacter bilis]
MNYVIFGLYFLIASIYYKRKKYKISKKYFVKASEIVKNNAKTYFKIGMSCFHLKEWNNAKLFFEQACSLKEIPSWRRQLQQVYNHLKFGFFVEQKLWWKEISRLEQKLNHGNKNNFIVLRDLAIAYEAMKRYKDAANHYEKSILLQEKQKILIEPVWYYRLGFCYEKIQDTILSIQAYQKAIELDENLESDIFGIGIFHEKMGYWYEANIAYLDKLQKCDIVFLDKIFYKIAFSFEMLYDWKNSEKYYHKALDINYHCSLYHYRLGVVLERQDNFKQACIFYKEAVARDSYCNPEYFYRLGNCLMRLEDYKEACKIFTQINRINNYIFNHNLNFSKDNFFKQKAIYLDFYENENILENVILYQSHTAQFMSCNPYAIFLSLLKDSRFDNFIHIWVLQDLNFIPLEFQQNKKIIFVKCFSKLYFKYLASAKYLINSGSFCRFFIRKPEQKYLATWHGTPWKCLGKDIKRGFMEFEITQKDFLQSTHIISPNKHTSDVLIQKHDIGNIFKGSVYESGYPRIDLTLTIDKLKKQQIRERLNIKIGDKVILYAPTYRNSFENPDLNTERIYKDLELFAESGFNVLFRGHYNLETKLKDKGILSVPRDIDTNELLSVIDVLISDYSSIIFDFMVLNRPIIYYIYDYEEYKSQHGLYFEIEMLNSIHCKTAQQVLEILKNPLMLEKCKTSQEIKDIFLLNEDGFATQRVIDFFFFDHFDNAKLYKMQQNKINLLIYPGGLGNNGISASFANFLNYLDLNIYNVHIAVDSWQVRQSPICIKYVRQIQDKVYILSNPNILSQTQEENWLLTNPIYKNKRSNQEQEEVFAKCFERDFQCLYGDSKFDCLISFDGYGELWVYRFAYAKINAKKIIYLHNDMKGEFEVRFPYLEKIFNLYKYFDHIFSVSKELSDLNRNNLSSVYNIKHDKFDFMNNIIDYKNILFKSGFTLEHKEDEIIFNDNFKVFINIARLSPEKNQMTLIKAFQKLNSKFHNTRLIILGDGPLKEDLNLYISKNNIKNVYLLGHRNNPYAYLKKSDCFILSSLHEGQPMVLLESLVLNKPIIATNITGNKSVLNSYKALMSDIDDNSLAKAMEKFLTGPIQTYDFNFIDYNNAILDKFNRLFGINLKRYNNNKYMISPCIIMAKPDGFGMRLFAIMSGLLLSQKTKLPFYFKWGMVEDVIGNTYEMFNSIKHIPFALGKVDEIFNKNFIQKYYISCKDIKSNHGFGIFHTKKTFNSIKNGPFEQKWGWYAPGIEGGALSNWIKDYNEDQCYKDFSEIYRQIGFSDKYQDIIKHAKQIAKKLGSFIAIHIRGADIIYSSTYKKASLYGFVGDKYFPYEIAIEIIKNEINNKIIIFSQDVDADKLLINQFNNDQKIILADQFASQFSDLTERAFFEMNLLSHAVLIYTPGISLQKSAFSQCPSFFSGVKKDISFHKIFSEKEQYQIIQKNIDKLDLNSMYRSMAFFRLYQLSLKLEKDYKTSLQIIEKAIFEDSSNTAWIIHWIHLNLCYGYYDVVEKYLIQNLNKIQCDLLSTLFLFRGKIYKTICFDIVKMKNSCKKYPNLLWLIKEISIYYKL